MDPEFPDEIRKVQYVVERDFWAKPLVLELKDVISRVEELRIAGGTNNLRDAALICQVVLEVLEEEITTLEIFEGTNRDQQRSELFFAQYWNLEDDLHYIRGAGPHISSKLYAKMARDEEWYERQDAAERKSALIGIHYCVCLSMWLPGQFLIDIELNLEW